MDYRLLQANPLVDLHTKSIGTWEWIEGKFYTKRCEEESRERERPGKWLVLDPKQIWASEQTPMIRNGKYISKSSDI